MRKPVEGYRTSPILGATTRPPRPPQGSPTPCTVEPRPRVALQRRIKPKLTKHASPRGGLVDGASELTLGAGHDSLQLWARGRTRASGGRGGGHGGFRRVASLNRLCRYVWARA
ncbi:hypothetical protein M758_8G022200 [Ceratodon purpureus]|nr:hypothetical protein M758_8G022200 [Ceratodon purpureus]